MKRLFITGTDTGVGKTLVACTLARLWTSSGRSLGVLKPVETGCALVEGELLAEDARALAQAAGLELSLSQLSLVCAARYAAPASPETAAFLDGTEVPRLATLLLAAERAGTRRDALLLEGAGGILVPLAPDLLQVDLVVALEASVLIVARERLGTINHTLLTIEALRNRGIAIVGVVLNQTERPSGPEEPHVAARLIEHAQVPILGRIPYFTSNSRIDQNHLDAERIWEGF